MFRVTRYPMISKTESGRVGYQKKYRVAGRVRVPAGHCLHVVLVLQTYPMFSHQGWQDSSICGALAIIT